MVNKTKPLPPPAPVEHYEPPDQPSLISMAAIVAGIVAVVILVFSVLGFMLGKFIF